LEDHKHISGPIIAHYGQVPLKNLLFSLR